MPTSILSGYVHRWRASSITNLADQALVSTCSDEGSGSKNLSQPTSSRQPKWVANGIGSKAAFLFDGVDDTLWTDTTATRYAPATHFYVLAPNVTGNGGSLLWMNGQETYWLTSGGTSHEWGIYQSQGLSLATEPDRRASLWSSVFTSGTTDDEMRVNGFSVLKGSAGDSAQASSLQYWVGHHGTLARPYFGMIAEVIIYPFVLTNLQFAQVGSYVQDTYPTVGVVDYISTVVYSDAEKEMARNSSAMTRMWGSN